MITTMGSIFNRLLASLSVDNYCNKNGALAIPDTHTHTHKGLSAPDLGSQFQNHDEREKALQMLTTLLCFFSCFNYYFLFYSRRD
jgi:hypothetical protein